MTEAILPRAQGRSLAGNTGERRLLIISPVKCIPADHGFAIRVWEIANELSRNRFQVRIVSLSSLLSPRQRTGRITRQRIDYFEMKSWDPQLCRLISWADIVQFEHPFYPHLMVLARMLGKRVILDEHGVEATFLGEVKTIRYLDQRKLGAARERLGEFLRGNMVVLAQESAALAIAHRIIVTSRVDLASLHRLYGLRKGKAVVIPNVIPLSLTAQRSIGANLPPNAVVFVGSFDHLPNLYAVKVILEQILPLVTPRSKSKFVLIGRNPPQALIRQAELLRVTVLGDVPDVAPYVSGAEVAICPIWHGSGTRIKILEYMALSRPVVSTSKGAEGLEVTDGVNIIIRNTSEGFAEAISFLLKNPQEARRIGEAGLDLVKSRYSWNALGDRLGQVYD